MARGRGLAFYALDVAPTCTAQVVLVLEDEPGYFTLANEPVQPVEKAERDVKCRNAQMGLTEDEARRIVASSMAGRGLRRRHASF